MAILVQENIVTQPGGRAAYLRAWRERYLPLAREWGVATEPGAGDAAGGMGLVDVSEGVPEDNPDEIVITWRARDWPAWSAAHRARGHDPRLFAWLEDAAAMRRAYIRRFLYTEGYAPGPAPRIPAPPAIRRVLMIKLRDGVSPAEMADLRRRLLGMPEHIPVIKRWACEPNLEPTRHDCDLVWHTDFPSLEAHDKDYVPNAYHMAVVDLSFDPEHPAWIVARPLTMAFWAAGPAAAATGGKYRHVGFLPAAADIPPSDLEAAAGALQDAASRTTGIRAVRLVPQISPRSRWSQVLEIDGVTAETVQAFRECEGVAQALAPLVDHPLAGDSPSCLFQLAEETQP
jgi:hypothetical protein